MPQHMKIGVVLPNWIGDVALATPALRALSEHFRPQAHIVGIMRPYVAEVLEGTPWLDEELYYDPKSSQRGLQAPALIDQLRGRRLDCLLLLTNSLRTAWIGWRSGTRRRIGYARNGRGLLLTDKLEPPRRGFKLTPISAVDSYLELASLLGCVAHSRHLELATTPKNEHAADRMWEQAGLSTTDRIVTICPSGAYGRAKHWPEAHFATLARRLLNTYDCRVLVVCGPAEREIAQRIASAVADDRLASIANEPLSIGLSKACLARSDLVVTTDSGPRHLAAGFGVPTIALFGPTDPRWTMNYNPREIRLQEDLSCAPCAKRECPLIHHHCMRQLSVDKVLHAADELFRIPKPAAA